MSNESRGRSLVSIERSIRERYQERRRVTQPAYAINAKNDAHFLRAAEVVLSLKADPSQYVDAIFNSWGSEGHPQPPNLASATSIKKYEETAEDERCPPQMEVDTQKVYLTNYVKRAGLSKDEAMLATWTTLRSYFRCMFCSETARVEVYRMFGKVGRAQIENDSSLRRYLEQKYPRHLQEFLEPVAFTIPAEDDEELPVASNTEDSWENRPEVPEVCH